MWCGVFGIWNYIFNCWGSISNKVQCHWQWDSLNEMTQVKDSIALIIFASGSILCLTPLHWLLLSPKTTQFVKIDARYVLFMYPSRINFYSTTTTEPQILNHIARLSWIQSLNLKELWELSTSCSAFHSALTIQSELDNEQKVKSLYWWNCCIHFSE